MLQNMVVYTNNAVHIVIIDDGERACNFVKGYFEWMLPNSASLNEMSKSRFKN